MEVAIELDDALVEIAVAEVEAQRFQARSDFIDGSLERDVDGGRIRWRHRLNLSKREGDDKDNVESGRHQEVVLTPAVSVATDAIS